MEVKNLINLTGKEIKIPVIKNKIVSIPSSGKLIIETENIEGEYVYSEDMLVAIIAYQTSFKNSFYIETENQIKKEIDWIFNEENAGKVFIIPFETAMVLREVELEELKGYIFAYPESEDLFIFV